MIFRLPTWRALGFLDPVNIKNSQVQQLLAGLSALDGYDRAVKLGDGTDRVIREPYKLGAKARWNITRNVRTLNTAAEDLSKTRDALITEISGGGNQIPSGTPEHALFVSKLDQLLKADQELPLLKMNLSDLALDTNPIPTGALAAIYDLIIEDQPSS